VTDDLTWSALDDDSFDELRTLAHASLEADGGMPLFTGEQMLRGRMLIGQSIAARDASGALVAAASLSLGDSGATTTGMVHPARRGEGLGTRLLQWARDRAGQAPLTVATETLSERAERLYARFGLAEVFAEDVMRHDLSGVPDLPVPERITLTPVSAADHTLLFEAYIRSFADRPGSTPGTPLVVSDERNRARVAVCRTTHDDVHAMSSHGLTESGQLTGPVVELDSERTHVVLLSAPHDWK
jgi:GNAT superfamily N-acetyltransferase